LRPCLGAPASEPELNISTRLGSSSPPVRPAARVSCSARTAASSCWTFVRIGARVSRALRQRVSWFAYRSSSPEVSCAISRPWSSGMGDPGRGRPAQPARRRAWRAGRPVPGRRDRGCWRARWRFRGCGGSRSARTWSAGAAGDRAARQCRVCRSSVADPHGWAAVWSCCPTCQPGSTMTTWRALSATQPPHRPEAMPRREFQSMANDRDPETNAAAFLGAELRRARCTPGSRP